MQQALSDLAHLLERASCEGWGVVAIDLGTDTTTPTGELVANIMASVSRWERRMIGARTREVRAVAKATGARLDAPVRAPPRVSERIAAERREGFTLAAIAYRLNQDGVPVAGNGKR